MGEMGQEGKGHDAAGLCRRTRRDQWKKGRLGLLFYTDDRMVVRRIPTDMQNFMHEQSVV